MLDSVDKYLDRVRHKGYNCWDFTCEVWLELTGEDIRERLPKLVGDFRTRRVTIGGIRGVERLDKPIDPCIVVMQRLRMVPHVGVYLRGRLLHLPNSGAEFRPLDVAKRCYQKVTYYR